MSSFRNAWLVAVPVLTLLAGAPVMASDPVGIYAIIDKVELLPNPEHPERVRVWGAFCMADGHGRKFGQYYGPPVRGYLYFTLDEEKPEKCLDQWRDLASVAGKGECVAFGSRYDGQPKVHAAKSEAKEPDPYALGWGVRKMAPESKRMPVVRLQSLPRPVSPAEGDVVDPGDGWRKPNPLVLIAENCVEKADHYVFELECENGEIIASPLVPAGKERTEWTVPGLLRPGLAYTWRVRIIGKDTTRGVSVASTRFTVKAAEKK